ncbi:hypothetical protein ABI59_17710 [Acidobacteria bacterium Mor1]|nr:hypothetical protein ABI59_17710 [Acidobacteria bacterium Mor1]
MFEINGRGFAGFPGSAAKLAACAIGAWAICALPASPAWAQCDEQPPALVDFDFTPTAVDVTGGSQVVTVTVEVSDDVAGVDLVGVTFESPGMTQRRSCNSDTPASGTPNAGTYTCDVTFDGNPEQGVWLVSSITISDRVSRSGSVNTGDLLLRGLPTQLTVTSIEDVDAPVLTDLTVTPLAVDVSAGAQPVTCAATVTDNLAGVTGLSCQVVSPTEAHRTSCVELFPTSGTPQSGVFDCDLMIPRYGEAGTWLLEVTLSDAEGNRIEYLSTDLAALAFPDSIVVTSSPEDLTPPVLADFDLQPPSINVENNTMSVTCSGRLTDNLAGSVSLGCTATNLDLSTFQFVTRSCADIDIDSGTPLDGKWSCDLVIPQYSPGGTWDVTAVVFDGLGNAQAYDGDALDALSFPSSFEVICGTGSGGVSPRVTWASKEVLTWAPVLGALLYEPYGGDLATLVDLDLNGLPDAGYGACRLGDDLDPTDTEFTDSSDPAPGQGEYILIGYRTVSATGLGLGATSDSLPRDPTVPCP